jgi:hypothetical protein
MSALLMRVRFRLRRRPLIVAIAFTLVVGALLWFFQPTLRDRLALFEAPSLVDDIKNRRLSIDRKGNVKLPWPKSLVFEGGIAHIVSDKNLLWQVYFPFESASYSVVWPDKVEYRHWTYGLLYSEKDLKIGQWVDLNLGKNYDDDSVYAFDKNGPRHLYFVTAYISD